MLTGNHFNVTQKYKQPTVLHIATLGKTISFSCPISKQHLCQEVLNEMDNAYSRCSLQCRDQFTRYKSCGNYTSRCLVMVVLWNRAGHYIFALWFLSFTHLISAVTDWMCAILPHSVALVQI